MFSKPCKLRPAVEPNIRCVRSFYIASHGNNPKPSDILKRGHVLSTDIDFYNYYKPILKAIREFYPDATIFLNKFYSRNRGRNQFLRFKIKRTYKSNLITL